MSNREINKPDWSDAIGHSLRDAEHSPSTQLWERIELSITPSVTTRTHSLRWIMAAAAIVAVGLFAVNLMVNDILSDKVDDSLSIAILDEEIEPAELIELSIEEPEIEPLMEPEVGSEMEPRMEVIKMVKPQPSYQFVTEQVVDEPEQLEEPQEFRLDEPKKQEESNDQTMGVKREVTPSAKAIPIKYLPSTKQIDQSKRSIAMNIGGGSLQSTTGVGNVPKSSPHLHLVTIGYRELSFEELYGVSKVDHHQPLSFELSVGQSISNNLTLVSGVGYSLYRSDVMMVSKPESVVQKLQFLSIPIRLQSLIWSHNNFSLYGGVSTQVDYCLSASVDNVSFDEQRWHYSVGGVFGAQYDLSRSIGLYCEPEFSYYLTKTDLKTIRNDAPLGFVMRVGVRFAM